MRGLGNSCITITLLMCSSFLAYSKETEEKAVRVNPQELIECKATMENFAPVMGVQIEPLQAIRFGWIPLPQANMFMSEFRLLEPINVFGYSTKHIAVSGNSILAILDSVTPQELAEKLQLEVGIDTPEKVMYGREVRADEVIDPETNKTVVESVILSVSTVQSHPNKTLAGCSYSLDSLDDSSEENSIDPDTKTPAMPVETDSTPPLKTKKIPLSTSKTLKV